MIDVRIAANLGVIRYLERRKPPRAQSPDVRAPGDPKHDYLGLGCHPDVVERVWKEIGRKLPQESRQVVLDTPALVHPPSGTLLAVAIGTSYAVRLPSSVGASAVPRAKTEILWSNGTRLDLAHEFGGDWVAGSWSAAEEMWCVAKFAELESKPRSAPQS
jgi:hypothetical protein